MASRKGEEVRFTIGLSLFWFALSYQFSPGTLFGPDFPSGTLSVGLSSFAQSGCIIALAIAYLVLSQRRNGEAPRAEGPGTATLSSARFRQLSRIGAFASMAACILLVLLSAAPISPRLASAADVACSVLFGAFLGLTSLRWAEVAARIGKRRACVASVFSFLANLLVALGLTILLGGLGAERLFGPIVSVLPLVSAFLAFAPESNSPDREEHPDRAATDAGEALVTWGHLLRSPYTQTAAALLFYLFASYLFSGLYSSPGSPFSTTLLSKVAAVALAAILVALVVRQANERAGFLRVLVFFMLVCVAVSYLVVMLINDRPDLCQQIVLPTRILALFLLWETALMYSASARIAPVAAVAALYLVPIGVEVSFPVFAGFASPLLSGLSVYIWLGSCIIPAVLLLILAVLKMQGASEREGLAKEPVAEGESISAVGNEAVSSGGIGAAPSVHAEAGASVPAVPSEPVAATTDAEVPSSVETAPAPSTAGGRTALDARCMALSECFALTPREGEVLRLLAAGNSQRKIADVLVVSLSSAQTYSKNVYRKLGVHSRQEVIDLVSQSD